MNNNKTILGTLLSATALLAAMGCWFCWHCPSRIYPPESHGLFWRQLAWNSVGLAVFAGAWLAGWRRLLKAAPWLMAAWLVAITAAQLSSPVHGVHKWLSLGPLRINVATCFMPVAALFTAWLRDRKLLRPWMCWAVVSLTVVWAVWHVAGDCGRMERLAAFFDPRNWMQDRAYMSRQLLAALGASRWFGDAGRSLGFLPCPESDGMMSASALMFGKWFPAALIGIFAVVGASLSLLWKGTGDAAKRMFAILFGLWLTVPAAYCFLHSLALLPVAGMSPALAGYGGTAVVMAWFGTGILSAMVGRCAPVSGCDTGTRIGVMAVLGICGAWIGIAVLGVGVLVLRCLSVEAENLKFAEPRPSDMEFGEFGLVPKRGRILAADGSPLAYTVRSWSFHVDPRVPEAKTGDSCRFAEAVALGFRLNPNDVRDAYQNTQSRYVPIREADDKSPENDWYERNRRLAKKAGIIREPVQKRIYPLGEAATAVVGFMHGGAPADTPQGAGGLEWAFDKPLAGTDGVGDARLRLDERARRVPPAPGADVRTTIIPDIQKAAWGALAAACATNGAESAFALVMKVPSGEIAAMASWPSFDPSRRRELGTWDFSMAANRAAQTVFEPGGLARPMIEAIALDSGVEADVTNIVSWVGAEKFHAALRRFGFGSKTGTTGIPGEEVGILAAKPEVWEIDTTAPESVGHGHGFAVTGLQLAQAYATLANHGTLVRPVLIAEGARSCATNDTTKVVSPIVADTIVRMLKSPIHAAVPMCEHDRETGRSVYSPTNGIASCAGYHPAEQPDCVIVVSCVRPKAASAGPDEARSVFTDILNLLSRNTGRSRR